MKAPFLVVALFVAALRPLCADDAGSEALAHLNRIILPRIHLEESSVDDALDFLWARSVELDTLELDPTHKGFTPIKKVPMGKMPSDGVARWPDQGFKITYKARNIPLLEALAEVTNQGNVDCYLTDVGIVICQPGDAAFPNSRAAKGKILKTIHRAGKEDAGGAKGEVPKEQSHSVADYSNPIKTYQTFLEAIKRDDVAAAKACCTIADDNRSGSLDVLVGMWVTFHHFNKIAMLYFREDASKYLKDGADHEENPYLRGDCTDKALERTISRLADSKVKIKDDEAEITIKWEKDDGYPNQAFFYSNDKITYRRIDGIWKIDIYSNDGTDKLSEIFEPGSWGCIFRDSMNMLNAVIMDIELGRLKTWQQVTEELEIKTKVLEKKWTEDHHDPVMRAGKQMQSKDTKPAKENNPEVMPKQ